MSALNGKNDNSQIYHALHEGAIIGRYTIIKHLGSGGMGDVYLATDTELRRSVALKFLSLTLGASADGRSRFIREAQAAARLNHPNIITIYEVGDYKGWPFIAMEYIEGQSLKDIIAHGALALERASEICLQLCNGLAEAHAAGIIHRDIKPANILMDKKGRVKILDFGLAAVEGCEPLTKTGSTIGTVSYMSPEQVLGKELDQRSDIFSLGVVFYEMLTGHLPFKGEHDAVMMYAIANEDPEPLSSFRSNISDNLQSLIDLLLVKDPNWRIQDARELVERLEKLKTASSSDIPSRQAKKSIAVIYFQDFARNEDISWLSKGIPHMLITSLEQSKNIDVVSYQKIFDILDQMGKAETDAINMRMATEIARRTRATMMVTGCVFKYGQSIRLDFQINDVASGRLIKAGKVSGQDPFALADELGSKIRENLEVQETEGLKQHVADVTTHSLEAYRNYIEGIDNWNRARYESAAGYLNKALSYDPTFAMAYYWLAWVMYFSTGSPGDNLEKVAKYSKNLSPKEQDYIKSQNTFLMADFIQKREQINPIIADFPEEKEPYLRMWFLFPRPQDSITLIRSMRQALKLDPLYREGQRGLFYAYLNAGKVDYAIGRANKYMSLYPRDAEPYDLLGEVLAYAGEHEKSIEAIQKALQLKNNEYRYIMHLGAINQCMNKFNNAKEYYDRIYATKNKESRLMGAYYLCQLASYQGKLDEALSLLDNIIREESSERETGVWASKMHLNKSHIYHELRQYDEALKEYHLAIRSLLPKSSPVSGASKTGWYHVHQTLFDSSSANISIGWYQVQILASMGALDEARKTANTIKAEIEYLVPHWVQLYFLMEAIISIEENNYDKANEYLHKIELKYFNPNRMQIDFIIAKLFIKVGNATEAVRILEQLSSSCHFNKIYWSIYLAKIPYYLGIAYEQLGRIDDAIQQFRNYLEIHGEADSEILELENSRNRLAKLIK